MFRELTAKGYFMNVSKAILKLNASSLLCCAGVLAIFSLVNSSLGAEEKRWLSFQPVYHVRVGGSEYAVIRTSDDKIDGMRGGRGFVEPDGKPVDNRELVKKLVKTSWVWENIVQPLNLPPNFHGLDKPEVRIWTVSQAIETYGITKFKEAMMDLVVRSFVDASVVALTGGLSSHGVTTLGIKLTENNASFGVRLR